MAANAPPSPSAISRTGYLIAERSETNTARSLHQQAVRAFLRDQADRGQVMNSEAIKMLKCAPDLPSPCEEAKQPSGCSPELAAST